MNRDHDQQELEAAEDAARQQAAAQAAEDALRRYDTAVEMRAERPSRRRRVELVS